MAGTPRLVGRAKLRMDSFENKYRDGLQRLFGLRHTRLPAKAGIQANSVGEKNLDSRVRGNDE